MGGLVIGFLAFFLLGASSVPKPSKVTVKKFKNSRYELLVNNKNYIVRGVCYNPVPVGENHEYDWWTDLAKPWIADGKLMKEMGVNTIRIYQLSSNPDAVRAVIRDFYNLYGIRVMLGNWLGFWNYPCPFYGDKNFQAQVKSEVLEMVKLYKDEPGVLFWVLGNENNYSCRGQVRPWSSDEIDKEPNPSKQVEMRFRTYYNFLNDLAKEIHKIDPNHPVAIGNGEQVGLEYANQVCPDVDIIACIIYRGKTFGNLFNSIKLSFDRPIVIAEFGADAYDAFLNKEDQNMQAFFLENQWDQIYKNLNNSKAGAGNCLGGTMFEWTDEWWKHNESDAEGWKIHDTGSNWQNGNYYFDNKGGTSNMNEEWFGIVAVSQELENGINKRFPRKAYYVVREFWKDPLRAEKDKKKVKGK